MRGEPWFLNELVTCTGKVLARSADGDLFFVGRSLDSMSDLLSGALAGLGRPTVHQLPISFHQRVNGAHPTVWRAEQVSVAQRAKARRVLAGAGVTPGALARQDRPAVFVDVVNEGRTFSELFELLRAWVGQERADWELIRHRLRFVGVTSRPVNCPNTRQWHQQAGWTAHLPPRAIVDVPLDPAVWSYFGDHQPKLPRPWRPGQLPAGAVQPGQDGPTRLALAEAAALVAYGGAVTGRRALARAMGGERALSQPWLRSLIRRFNRHR